MDLIDFVTARSSHFWLLLGLFVAACEGAAAELQLALAPRIDLPTDLPSYREDSVSFYGTNVYLLESPMLRQRAEAATGHPAPATLKVHAERIPNTALITVSVKGADDSVAMPFLQALVDQFLEFKREQKKKFYRDAIERVDAALKSAPPEAVPQIEKYKTQLLVASLLDTEPAFQLLERK